MITNITIQNERSILAAMLKEPRSVYVIAPLLKPQYFQKHEHQVFYSSALTILRRRQGISIQEIARVAKESGDEIEPETLCDIADSYVPNEEALVVCAHEQRRIYQEKCLHELLIHRGSLNDLEDYKNLYNKMGELLDSSGDRPFSESQKDAYKVYERIQEIRTKKYGAIDTGYHELDRALGGMWGGELVILGGRPGSGKTTFGLCCLWNIAPADKVGIISCEMSRDALYLKMFGFDGAISAQRLRRGALNDDDYARLAESANKIASKGMVFDFASFELDAIILRARRMIHEYGIKILLVDYCQLIMSTGDNEERKVAAVSMAMKHLATTMDICVILISQLNRASMGRQDKKPRIEDLRQSGQLEQDADIILLMHRDESNASSVIVGKHRATGYAGEIPLTFNHSHGWFENWKER